ncbi:hypothetical protein BN988_00138 [Oceanobacillus picturae]|uniref:DUF2507 domain-containing protein n=2 Tax=Oceanobacillus picturae TaxID=171693 RepID=W9A7E7_9BACI|nr:hypothetical protein BN988_00138 [Oceanobacillus picturae]
MERMTFMSKEQDTLDNSLLTNLQSTGAGYDILRYIGLPEIFGSESDTLLYFMGRNLARKFALETMEDIYDIVEKLGWGKLELVKEKKKELVFQLMADSVAQRLQAPLNTDFRLEAGFLAEAVQRLVGHDCECTEDIHRKIHQVQFNIMYTK